MKDAINQINLPDEVIAQKIFLIRGKKVMLDKDLAKLYGIETKRLKEQVRRNRDRFPEDFMFELSNEELMNLRSQIATSSWGGTRYPPLAFSELGVAMLSSILNSKHAIAINIHIMRVFVRFREILETHDELTKRMNNLERKDIEQDNKILLILKHLKKIKQAEQQRDKQNSRKPIGYKRKEEQ